MQRVSDRVSYTVFLAIGALCILTFLVVRLPRAQRNCVLGLDGRGYFSYVRSFVFDGDLRLHNEGAYFDGVQGMPSTGLPDGPLAIGTALFWAPFYLLGHLLSLLAHALGMQVDNNGYGLVYQSAVCIATIVYVTLGCFLTYRVCRRYFSAYASLVAVAGLWLASALLHYTVGAAYMSHGVSFFAVSLFLFLWHPPRLRTNTEWAVLGLSLGLMALVRWQDLLYASVLLVEGVQVVKVKGPMHERAVTLRGYVKGGLLAGLVGAVVFAPQVLYWITLHGLPTPGVPGTFFDMLYPNLLDYLFSTRHGLYTWHPIMLLATVGLVPLWQRDKKVAAALLAALLAQWYLNSATTDWWAHASFGARRFISATPMLALGMAALAQSLTNRFRRGALVLAVTVSVLVCWNFLFDLQFSWGFIPHEEPLTLRELTVGKLEMILQLINHVVS